MDRAACMRETLFSDICHRIPSTSTRMLQEADFLRWLLTSRMIIIPVICLFARYHKDDISLRNDSAKIERPAELRAQE